jgi:nucleotide-binding universal stress UspA family protein
MTSEQGGAPAQATNTGRIVVGIDGSAAATEALHWAAHQAELTGSTLEIIMTWDWPPSYGWAMPYPSDFDPEHGVQAVVEQAASDLRTGYSGIEVTGRALQGHPAPILVEASKGADLLVVGCRGHGEFVGMLIGSVSEYCVTNAHCPVLVHRSDV